MTPRGIIAACTVLTLALSYGTAHAQNTYTWTCWASNTDNWPMEQPVEHYNAGLRPNWTDCTAWRNGPPAAGWIWSYGIPTPPQTDPATTTTDEPTTTSSSTTTTTTTTEPETTTTAATTTTTTTDAPTTTTSSTTTTAAPTTTQPKTPTTQSSILPTTSSTAPAETSTSSSSVQSPGSSTTSTVAKTPAVTVHGVKPRKGFGAGTTPATPTTITVTVLLTSPISPVGQILRKRSR